MTVPSLSRYRAEWFGGPAAARRDILAGMVGTFALIPEVIAFSFVAGIDPEVGLFASFVIGIVIAFAGGRPAMISGAAGSVALVAAALVHAHGLPYLLAATLLAGVFQILFGLAKLDVLMRFVSRSVRTGFVNALAILIFSAQLPQMLGVDWHSYAMIAGGLAIIYLAPRLTTAVPSPLICIVVLTAISLAFPMPIHAVADLGRLPSSLPSFAFPHLPATWQTLRIVAPYALAMAAVGLLESMMTATVVDDLTGTTGSKARECTGLGLANVAAGLFGGIAGCGMIGQTVGNVRYGGRGRLSTLVAGVFLLVVMVPLRPWVAQVPVAALVAIMIMVSISTFSWSSLRDLLRHPKVSGVVMLATVAVTVATHDLSAGVVVGVLLSGVFFAFKVTRLMDVAIGYDTVSDTRIYTVTGQIFFASADIFAERFGLRETARHVRIDLTHAHLWDVTAVGALEDVVGKLRKRGIAVETMGLNRASAVLVDRHAPLVRKSFLSPTPSPTWRRMMRPALNLGCTMRSIVIQRQACNPAASIILRRNAVKTSHRMLAAVIGMGVLAGAAQAQTVDQRHADQQHRIDQGLRTGSMTPGEAHRVERQQHSIGRQENRMRDRNGGHLNGYDRAVLQHRENRASHHIYHAKHNGRRW